MWLKAISVKLMVALMPWLGFFPSTGMLQKKTPTNAASSTHEKAANDPSPQPALTLKHPVPQMDLLIKGTLLEIFASATSATFTSPRIQSTMTYEDALQSPELFRTLAQQRGRFTPLPENGPTLANADHEFAGLSDRRFGFCWGTSTLIRNFNTVAFFDATLPRSSSIKFYEEKIADVLEGKATVIPGFKNFRELSSVPELEYYLKLSSMAMWRSLAAQPSSLPILFKAGKTMTSDEMDHLIQDLDIRFVRGEFPKLIFSSLFPTNTLAGLNTDIHVVLAYRLERLENHSVRIHIWDSNFYAESLQKSPAWIEITADHQMIYPPWHQDGVAATQNNDRLARVSITPENDLETAMILQELKQFCSSSAHQHHCSPKLF